MDDIRRFIKKVAPKDSIKLYIKYYDTYNEYKYKYYNTNLIFKEIINNDEDDSNIELEINKEKYNNYNDIQLKLFELFEYKNIEYIDIYLQKKIEKSLYIIEDIYDDFYDDLNDKLISTRLIRKRDKPEIIIKFKFIVYNKTDIKLYYNFDVINDFDNIIKKIDEIII